MTTEQLQQVEAWVRRLAAQVLAGAALDSFLALPLKDRVFGIAFFGALGDDAPVRATALSILDEMERTTYPQSTR